MIQQNVDFCKGLYYNIYATILAILATILAFIVGMVVAIFVYPYAIVKNIKHPDMTGV